MFRSLSTAQLAHLPHARDGGFVNLQHQPRVGRQLAELAQRELQHALLRQLGRVSVGEQQRVAGQDGARGHALGAHHSAQLGFQIEHRRGGKHRVRRRQAEQAAAAQDFVALDVLVAIIDDRLEVRHDRPFGHQLVELDQGQGPVRGIAGDGLGVVLAAFQSEAEDDFGELQQVAAGDGKLALDALAVDEGAVGAPQVADEECAVDDAKLGMNV